VLVHGQWLNAASMAPLGWRLARHGYAVSRFGYWSVWRGLEANARCLVRYCRRFECDRLSLVGHSLGGVLVLAALAQGLRAHRVVLMGSPFRDSGSARAIARLVIDRRIVGRTLSDWLHCEKPQINGC